METQEYMKFISEGVETGCLKMVGSYEDDFVTHTILPERG